MQRCWSYRNAATCLSSAQTSSASVALPAICWLFAIFFASKLRTVSSLLGLRTWSAECTPVHQYRGSTHVSIRPRRLPRTDLVKLQHVLTRSYRCIKETRQHHSPTNVAQPLTLSEHVQVVGWTGVHLNWPFIFIIPVYGAAAWCSSTAT